MKKLLVLLLFLVPASLRAQSQAWPDSSGPTCAGCYRIAVPPLSDVPPIRKDMSPQTISAYLWFDSIMRNPMSDSEWARFDSMKAIDTLKEIRKRIYLMRDYDPVLLGEYGRDAPNIDPRYLGKPAAMLNRFEMRNGQVFETAGSRDQYLTGVSYILHIKVLNVTRDWDTLANLIEGHGFPLCCIEAAVLDTMKGKHILTQPCETKPGDCFHLSFSPVWSKDGNGPMFWYMRNDSVAFRGGSMGWDAMKAGTEYIVFLRVVNDDYDGTNSYFSISPIMDGVGGIYPVVDGKVSDSKNYWRMGESVDLDTFKRSLRQRINVIEHP